MDFSNTNDDRNAAEETKTNEIPSVLGQVRAKRFGGDIAIIG